MTTPSLPAPSARDLEIFNRSVVLGHNQCTIAMDYNLHQPRISRILARVRRWLAAGGSPSDPAIRDQLAQQKLAKSLQKLRLKRVIERATYAMEYQQPSEVTTKSRYHGVSEVWREETRRQQPEINMPAMRLVLRAVNALDRLDATSDHEAPSKQQNALSESALLQSVFDFLCRLRARAEAAGQLPPAADLPQFIAHSLHALIGIPLGHLICQAQPATRNIPANIPLPPESSIAPTTDLPSLSTN